MYSREFNELKWNQINSHLKISMGASLTASRIPCKYPKATYRIQGLYLSHPLLLHRVDFNAWTDFPVFKNLLKICLLHFSERCSCADWRNQMAVHAVLILEHLSHFCQKFTCLIFLL